MKTNYYRNKRTMEYKIHPLEVKVEKRAKGDFSGVIQSIVNIAVYVLVFLIFLKDRMQYMGVFIAIMLATTIAQILLRVGKRLKRIDKFPYFQYTSGKRTYSNYLDRVMRNVDEYIADYSELVRSNLLSSHEITQVASSRSEKLWQRLPIHEDFLMLNLGESYSPLPIKVTYPNLGYDEKESQIEEFRDKLEEKIQNRTQCSLPTPYDLKKKKTISLTSSGLDSEVISSVINSIIIDTAVMQSPEELAICAVFDPGMPIDWVRLLPHVWDGEQRLLYDGSYPKQDFLCNVQKALESPKKTIVAFVDTDLISNYSDSDIYTFFNDDELPTNLCVVFFSVEGRTPNRVGERIHYHLYNGKIVGEYNGHTVIPYITEYDVCEIVAKQLFNTRLIDNKRKNTSDIPSSVTLYELLGVSSISDYEQWPSDKYPDLGKSFSIRIGKSYNGDIDTLHISNDGDGNHTYISGTNGSGKTEFIKTFILGACLRYSPEYFNFIFADFKMGSASSGLNSLAHCAGEFINGNKRTTARDVTRIDAMLRSEFAYRVSLCNQAGVSGIYSYQKLYFDRKRSGHSIQPLPLLLIVVDELAMMFSECPKSKEFIDFLATNGRQYGMLLLLAAQPKTGVISGQTKSNVNITIDFYSSDAADTIKGRATINSLKKKNKVSQIAWSTGASAYSREIDFISLSGDKRDVSGGTSQTQLVCAIQEIERRFPASQYCSVRREVLKARLEDLFGSDPLNLYELQDAFTDWQRDHEAGNRFPVGLVDDIYQRQRGFFTVSPNMGNTVVYGKTDSGKTYFIKTLILSMCGPNGLSPDDVQFHIVTNTVQDYRDFRFPQIGSIYPTEYVYYALLYLQKEIKRRIGMGSNTTAIPIILIFDGCYPTISEDKVLSRMFDDVARECEKYDISIILTLTQKVSSIIHTAIDSFNNHVAFFMGEDFDYSRTLSMTLNRIEHIPNYPGRCFVDIPLPGCTETTLEAQIALPVVENGTIRDLAYSWNSLWAGKQSVPQIPIMPNEIIPKADGDRILVGIRNDLEEAYWDLLYARSYLISYFYASDKSVLIDGMTKSAIEAGYRVIIIDSRSRGLSHYIPNFNVQYFVADDSAAEQALLEIKESPNNEKIMLVMDDFAKTLYPAGYTSEKKIMASTIVELLKDSSKLFFGVFADEKNSIQNGFGGAAGLVSYLEGLGSGMLIGNTPSSHRFGSKGFESILEQETPIQTGWGVHVHAQSSTKVKLITEVKR